MNFGSKREKPKASQQICGAGQGVGNIGDVPPAGDIAARLQREYQ
jgi:nitronate monooxygenase